MVDGKKSHRTQLFTIHDPRSTISTMSSPVTHLTDFSDRISPMLVKELRQGLRAKTFIAVFLALQVFLAVMLFSAGAASTSDHVGAVVSGIIFTFFAIAVLIVQPLRGTAALSSEVKGNTIDMMALTRLSAWRIVFGKWVAIVSQSALMLSTIIPYLILRYFFGGMNLLAEMVFLALLFLTSMALTAVTVGLSGCSSVVVRSLIPILGLPIMLWSLLVMSLSSGFRGSSGFLEICALDNTESRLAVALYVAAIAYIGGSMLSLGASLIAPAAENHSLLRRLAALALLLALFAATLLGETNTGAMVALVSVIAIPAIILALTESAPLVQTVCKPFAKLGAVGKLLGWLLYPCWSSGILFAIVIGLISLAGVFAHSAIASSFDAEEWVVIAALFGGLYFPAVWQVFLFRGDGQRIAHYLLLLVGSFILLGVLAALSNSMNNADFLWFFAWNPLAFIAMLDDSSASDSVLLAGAVVVDALLLLILFYGAIMDIRKSEPVVREAEASIQHAA
jgi:ABC-type transport system involved in multi-copper enzyme maturation permease subunit